MKWQPSPFDECPVCGVNCVRRINELNAQLAEVTRERDEWKSNAARRMNTITEMARERDEARTGRDIQMNVVWDLANVTVPQLRRERDEALLASREAGESLLRFVADFEDCSKANAKVCRERDEARTWAVRCWNVASKLSLDIAMGGSSHLVRRARQMMDPLCEEFGKLEWANEAVEELE